LLQVVDAVHAKGSFIYLQLWALGRTAKPEEIKKENPANDFTAPSTIPLTGTTALPRPMTIAEIKEFTQLYATAASNAVDKAGFDGVEIHGANGYLVDQFLQDVSNDRTDEYGGSVENRSRFALEVVDAVVKAVGEKKTGIRFSPWSTFQGQCLWLAQWWLFVAHATCIKQTWR
jgi:NADPH2 dehydrogenase